MINPPQDTKGGEKMKFLTLEEILEIENTINPYSGFKKNKKGEVKNGKAVYHY